MRDDDAGIKLRGSLLRLQIVRPEGFTAAELSEAAAVAGETARDFLKSSRYTEVVGTKPSVSGKGRPVNVYKVTEAGSDLLTEEIVRIRRQLLVDEGIPHEVFGSLTDLEEIIEEAEAAEGDARLEMRAEAERVRTACRSDLRALEKLSHEHGGQFRWRLASLEHRLFSLGDEDEGLSAIRLFVAKYGSWIDRQVSSWEPMLLIFDGIEGKDKTAQNVIDRSLQRDIPVASVDVAGMQKSMREEVFRSVGDLRTKTQLASCDVVLTVDSETHLGRVLVAEMKTVAPRVQQYRDYLLHDDGEYTRQNVLKTAARYIGSPDTKTRAFALRCTAALAAMEAFHVSSSHSDLNIYTSIHCGPDDPIDTARPYLGEVLCVDSSYSEAIASDLSTLLITYCPTRPVKA